MKMFVHIFCITALLMFSCKANVKSAFPLPNNNIHTRYIYISNQYINTLKITKSHPLAVYNLEKPYSPILFYQEYYDKYCASTYLHEGAPIVDIDKKSNEITIFGSLYNKIAINKTIENTIEEIIINTSFSKSKYKDNYYTVSINNGVYINNIKAHVRIDVGGGYNNIKQTMFMTGKKISGYSCFALLEKDNKLILTPLETDDVVAYSSGKTYILE